MKTEDISTYAIVATEAGYIVRELPAGELGQAAIEAAFADKRSAELAQERMEFVRQALEPQLKISLAAELKERMSLADNEAARDFLLRQSLEHEALMRNKMLEKIRAVIAPAPPASDPKP